MGEPIGKTALDRQAITIKFCQGWRRVYKRDTPIIFVRRR